MGYISNAAWNNELTERVLHTEITKETEEKLIQWGLTKREQPGHPSFSCFPLCEKLPTVEEIEIEIAEKVEEDNDGETGMIIREWAEKYRTKAER